MRMFRIYTSLICTISLLISGCSKDKDEGNPTIIGKWGYKGYEILFYQDSVLQSSKTVSYDSTEFVYFIYDFSENNSYSCTFPSTYKNNISGTYSLKGDQLTLKNNFDSALYKIFISEKELKLTTTEIEILRLQNSKHENKTVFTTIFNRLN